MADVTPATSNLDTTEVDQGSAVSEALATKIAANINARNLGRWDIGDVKMHHSFNGATTISRGWMRCNGDVVNQTNYDAIHGSGAYAADGVASSPLLNKNIMDMNGHYAVGTNSTTQDGTAPITQVGNSGHTVNLQHSHTVNAHSHTVQAHNHQVMNFIDVNTNSQVYDSGGSAVALTFGASSGTGNSVVIGTATFHGGGTVQGDWYTNNQAAVPTANTSPGTDNQLSTTTDIQPDSNEVEFWIKVV